MRARKLCLAWNQESIGPFGHVLTGWALWREKMGQLAHGLENAESGRLDKWGRADARDGRGAKTVFSSGQLRPGLAPLFAPTNAAPGGEGRTPLGQGRGIGHEAAF